MASRFTTQYGLDAGKAKQIVTTSLELAALFEELVGVTDVKTAVTWTTGAITANWKTFDTSKKDELVAIVKELYDGTIKDTECSIRVKALMTGRSADELTSAAGNLEEVINGLIDANLHVVDDYRKNPKAANMIIGMAMKQTGGAYSSSDIVEAVTRMIEERL